MSNSSPPYPSGTALTELGWGPPFDTAFHERHVEGTVPGRVARVDRGALTVLTESGEQRVLVAGLHDHAPVRPSRLRPSWLKVAVMTGDLLPLRHSIGSVAIYWERVA